MGRHSRKGNGPVGDTAETAAVGEDGSASPQVPHGTPPGDRPGREVPGPYAIPAQGGPGHGGAAGQGGPGRGAQAYGERPHGPYVPPAPHAPQGPPAARGGHPEHREPGGGWGGADAAGHGPLAGPAGGTAAGHGESTVGRVLADTSAGGGTPPGPRQEYLDAFDDVFAAGAPGVRGEGRGGPHAGRGPSPDGPRTPSPAPAAQAQVPGPGPGPGPGPEAEPEAEAAAVPQPRAARARQRGGRSRTATGVAAAAVTTVLAVVIAGQVAGTGQRDTRGSAAATPGHGASGPAASKDDGRGKPSASPRAPATYAQKMATVFPLAADFKGKGHFSTVGGHGAGTGHGQVLRYKVEVEEGLPLDGKLFAEAVHKTLNDKRSWSYGGRRSFERVSSGHADFVITLASPHTTDVWCAKSGLDTSEQHVSCDSAATARVMINGYRWARGSKTFGPDRILEYRQMLINHEVGHRIGHDHERCPRDGALAPVMMQQTKYLTTGNATCRPNAWPYPHA